MYMYEQTGAGETEVALHSQVNQVKFNSAFHPCGVGKSSTSLHGWGYTWSAFTCVGWQVTLCDSIWQVTSRSSEMGFPRRAISAFIFFYLCTLRDRAALYAAFAIHYFQPSLIHLSLLLHLI